MIVNSTTLNTRHRYHACNHERLDNSGNTNQIKQLHLVKARRLSKPKLPIKAIYDENNQQNQNEKSRGKIHAHSPLIVNDVNDLDEIEEIERLNNDSHLDNYLLDVPINHNNDRKVSMPIIRKSSHSLDIPDLHTRKLSTSIEDRRRKSSQVRNSALYLPRTQSLRSRQSLNLPNHQAKHLLSLHPATFKNENTNARNRFASIHVPLEVNRGFSLDKTPSQSEIPVESRNQDEIVGDLKFTTNLSTTGQCAMLKSYEDELYSQFKSKFPKKYFPRVNTPTFNIQMSATKKLDGVPSTSSLCSLPSYSSITTHSSIGRKTAGSISSWDMNGNDNEQIRKFQVNRQIEEAMEILDDLSKIKSDNQTKQSINQTSDTKSDNFSLNNRKTSITTPNDFRSYHARRSSRQEIDSIDLHKKRLEKNDANEAIKKYEKWQYNWSKMLTDMF